MKISKLSVLMAGAFSLIATPTFAADNSPWSYKGSNGPENWGALSKDYELCKTGMMQSPVDLAASNARADVSLFVSYKTGPLSILNNGHTIQANFAKGSSMTSGTMQFNLLQVHFHTPSEEAVNGKRYPMVGHFVHADDKGQLAVLGVMFEEGAVNAELDKLISAAPTQKADATTVAGVTLDPNGLLPSSLDVYRFQGSLTTPPCSEGVNWHVAKQAVSASKAQLDALYKIMGDNARPIQPLNGRLLTAPAN